MLKQVTVPIMVDDHESHMCSPHCKWLSVGHSMNQCILFDYAALPTANRYKQCLEEAE